MQIIMWSFFVFFCSSLFFFAQLKSSVPGSTASNPLNRLCRLHAKWTPRNSSELGWQKRCKSSCLKWTGPHLFRLSARAFHAWPWPHRWPWQQWHIWSQDEPSATLWLCRYPGKKASPDTLGQFMSIPTVDSPVPKAPFPQKPKATCRFRFWKSARHWIRKAIYMPMSIISNIYRL